MRRSVDPSGRPMMLWDADADMIDRQEAAERIDAADAAEPTESTEQAEPTEPTERMEPTEPIERMDPSLAIERMDPFDLSDQRDGDGWEHRWECRWRPRIARAYTRRHGGGMARGQP